MHSTRRFAEFGDGRWRFLYRVLCARTSIWIGRAGPGHANPVIRKGRVEAGRLILWHVATDAICVRDRASSAQMIGSLHSARKNVAAKANCIIRRSIGDEALVRIVAGETGDSRISVHPASTVLQAVRSKADVKDSDSRAPVIHYVLPGAMARAAEIYGSDGIEPARIEDGTAVVFDFSGFHGGHMFGSGAVARFTGNTRYRITRIKLFVQSRSHGVASKTETRFGWIHPSSRGFVDVRRRGTALPGSDVQRLQ